MKGFTCVAALLCLALTGCEVRINHGSGQQARARNGTESEQAAIRVAASTVLARLDAGQWDKAWSVAGKPLKETSTMSGFTMGVRASRAVFGEPRTRTIEHYQFRESLDGAPPGQYGIVFYRTDFSKVEGVDEQVVLTHEQGEWRLVGYWAEKRGNVKLP